MNALEGSDAMTAGGARQRRGTMGTTQWAALGISALVILGLTFTLGALVGRQWARHSAPALVAEPLRKAMPAPRRSGLTDVALEQPPAAQEKLTFYKTLTAPLETTPLPVKPEAAAKSDSAAKPATPKAQASPVSAVAPSSERTLPKAEERPSSAPSASSSTAKAVQPERAERRAAGPEWTVQVGVFGSVDQAIGFKKGLDKKGFETQIVPTNGSDGVRYRVRVGTFHSREEAQREAERVRSERSLPTYVTAK